MPKKYDIDQIVDELHPAQQAGLTVEGEELGGSSSAAKSTAEMIAHMGKESYGAGFVAEPDASEVWSFGDDRLFGGLDITYKPEDVLRMKAGYLCLRCHEPQLESFPLACDLCGYSMRELQIRDLAVEMTGNKHLGPSKPISDYLDELDELALKKKFAKKMSGGASRMTGLRK